MLRSVLDCTALHYFDAHPLALPNVIKHCDGVLDNQRHEIRHYTPSTIYTRSRCVCLHKCSAWCECMHEPYFPVYKPHTSLPTALFVKNLKSHIFVTLARRNCASECAYKCKLCQQQFRGKSCDLYARKFGICLVKKNTLWNRALGSPANEFCPFVLGFSHLLLGPLVFRFVIFF